MNNIEIFSHRNEAIDRAILPSLGEYANDYDLDAIFDAAFDWDEGGRGFIQVVTDAEFWTIVADSEI